MFKSPNNWSSHGGYHGTSRGAPVPLERVAGGKYCSGMLVVQEQGDTRLGAALMKGAAKIGVFLASGKAYWAHSTEQLFTWSDDDSRPWGKRTVICDWGISLSGLIPVRTR